MTSAENAPIPEVGKRGSVVEYVKKCMRTPTPKEPCTLEEENYSIFAENTDFVFGSREERRMLDFLELLRLIEFK